MLWRNAFAGYNFLPLRHGKTENEAFYLTYIRNQYQNNLSAVALDKSSELMFIPNNI